VTSKLRRKKAVPKVEKAPAAAKATDEVTDIPMAKVILSDAELTFEPTTVEYEKNGEKRSFEQDPGLNCKTIIKEVLVGDKEHEGKSFWQRWRMKYNKEKECWEVRENTSYGNLVEVRYGKGILSADDPRDLILEEEDFEDFELYASVVPKKNPQTDKLIGSMLKWDGVHAIGSASDPQVAQGANDAIADELPDDHEEQINDKLGI